MHGKLGVGGAKEDQELTIVLDEKSFQGQLAKEAKKRWGIEFIFNVEYTPHHSGRWEQMVKEFKRIVAKDVNSVAKMTYKAFATLLIRVEGIINQSPIDIDDGLRVITPMQLLQPGSTAAFGLKVGQSVPRIHEQVCQSVEYFWKLWRTHYLAQNTAERLTKGNARFFNLALGDKVLLNDSFRTLNVFAKADWTPVRATKIFQSSDGIVRTVMEQNENGNEQRLTTNKLAIVEEDLLNWYCRQQGLRTVAHDANNKDAATTPTIMPDDSDKEKMDQAEPFTVSTEDNCKPLNHAGSPTTQQNDDNDAAPMMATAAAPTRG